MLAEEIPKEHQKIKNKLILPSEKFIEKVHFLATVSKQNTNASHETNSTMQSCTSGTMVTRAR